MVSAMLRSLLLTVPLACAVAAAPATAEPWKSDAPAPASPAPLACVNSTGTVTPALGAAEADFGDTSTGDPYIVRVPISLVGGEQCHAAPGTRAQVELILPPGGRLFTAHPEAATPSCAVGAAPLVPCPVATRPGEFGGTILDDARGPQANPWQMPDDGSPLVLAIPVVFDDTINSFGRPEQHCAPLGPCAPAQAGGRIQFAVRFQPGGLGPLSAPLLSTVGAVSETEDAGDLPITDSPPASRLVSTFPRRLARATLRRGWVVRTYTQKGDTDTVTLKVGRHVIAQGRARARRKGPLSITVRPTRLGRGYLSARRTTKAKLTVTLGHLSESGTVTLYGS
jgi:hypothetical protein